MRILMTTAAILLAAFAFSPVATLAAGAPGGGGPPGGKGPGPGGGIGPGAGIPGGIGPGVGILGGGKGPGPGILGGSKGPGAGGPGGGIGPKPGPRPIWPDYQWNWYGRDWYRYRPWSSAYGWGGYDTYSYPAPSVLPANPAPGPAFSGGPIRIVNPASNSAALSYTLNGYPYTMQPGQSQDFQEDRGWVIQFSRGPNLGTARYTLHTGQYTFTGTPSGWELFQGTQAESAPPAPPTNLPAPSLPPSPQ